mgnify:CR=1 FL=1
MIQCPHCDAENLPDAAFCCKCGKRIQQKSKESLSSLQWVVLISLGVIVTGVFGLLLVLATGGQLQEALVQATSTAVPTPRGTRTPVPTRKPTATLTPKQRMTTYYPMDPRDLAKSPESYTGQRIKVFGQVFEISESRGETLLQIMSCPAYEEHYIESYKENIAFVQTPRSCEHAFDRQEPLVVYHSGRSDGLYRGHWVAVYGRVSGSVNGTNALGAVVTRPVIRADYLLYPLGRDDVVNTNW